MGIEAVILEEYVKNVPQDEFLSKHVYCKLKHLKMR